MIKKWGRRIRYLLLLVYFILLGCISEDYDTSPQQNSGKLALNVNWEDKDNGSFHNTDIRFDCVGNGVKNIEITILDPKGHTLLQEGPWECENHKGTIKGLPPGKITILLLATNESGEVIYRGIQKDVIITSGKTNKAKIQATYFIPSPLSPEEKRCTTDPFLTWQPVKGASEYIVNISENEKMNDAIIFDNIKESSFNFTDKKENTLYYWRVHARDVQKNVSPYSPVFHFSTHHKTVLKDISKGTLGSNPYYFTAIDNNIFFIAEGSINGESIGDELWYTNGTGVESGTFLLKDIAPGPEGSFPKELTPLNDKLLFTADDGIHGRELWVSDGTSDGTLLIKDMIPGSEGGSYKTKSTPYKGSIFWEVCKEALHSKCELWRSDGTNKGTKFIKKISVNEFYVADLSNNNVKEEYLYFAGDNGIHGKELWRTDGTPQGTVLIKDIGPNKESGPSDFTAINSSLFFIVDNELWQTDGTELGTKIVTDIHITNQFRTSHFFTVLNNMLLFYSEDAVKGYSLWKIDSTLSLTLLIDGLSKPAELIPNENKIFFVDHGLWKSDGTPSGTNMIKEIPPITDEKISFLKDLFFVTGTNKSGWELWRSDGTAQGTLSVKKFVNILFSEKPSDFFVMGDFLYFRASDPKNGTELWKSDGTTEGTVMIFESRPGRNSGIPKYFTKMGSTNYFIFSICDDMHGIEPWIGDGSGKKFKLLKDINKLKFDFPPKSLTVTDHLIFFNVFNLQTKRFQLWKSDGTPKGTDIVKGISYTDGRDIENETLTGINQTLFFASSIDYGNHELWKSSGDKKSTRLIHSFDIPTSITSNFTPLNELIFFTAWDEIDGEELWVSDGSGKPSGTYSIEIAPGKASSNPTSFLSMEDKLYFVAEGPKGKAIWSTDGITAHTKSSYEFSGKKAFSDNLIKLGEQTFYFLYGKGSEYGLWQQNVKSEQTRLIYSIARCSNLLGTKDRLFFMCESSPSNHNSVWISDGSFEGTKELIPANQQNSILKIVDVAQSDSGYFIVTTPKMAFEWCDLWFTDLQSENTYLIKEDIYQYLPQVKKGMIAVGDRLYFLAHDKETGHELWQSDGTIENTSLVWDINTGAEDGNPHDFTLFNNALYFTANGDEAGSEIRSICLDDLVH